MLYLVHLIPLSSWRWVLRLEDSGSMDFALVVVVVVEPAVAAVEVFAVAAVAAAVVGHWVCWGSADSSSA